MWNGEVDVEWTLEKMKDIEIVVTRIDEDYDGRYDEEQQDWYNDGVIDKRTAI